MGKPEMIQDVPEEDRDTIPVPALEADESPAAVLRRKNEGETYAGTETLEEIDEIIQSLNVKIRDHESYRTHAEDGTELAAEVDKDLARLTESLDMATSRRRELLKTIPLQDSDLHDELEEPL